MKFYYGLTLTVTCKTAQLSHLLRKNQHTFHTNWEVEKKGEV